MLPLSALPKEKRRRIRFLLSDIDGTLTHDRILPEAAYRALHRAARSGLVVIPVTGRPAGWCDLIIRQWPVPAVIGESGALAFWRRGSAIERLYWRSAEERRHDSEQLRAIGERACHAVKGAKIALDQAYREVDFAIDHAEDIVPPLAPVAIERLIAFFRAAGAKAEASSIHVNAWFGEHDKFVMAKRLLKEVFALDLDRAGAQSEIAAIGDAPNDVSLFAGCETSIGVANIRDFLGKLTARPRYATAAPGGFGFAEAVDTLLDRAQ